MVISKGKHKLELYDSTQLLPMRRYQKFQKYLMIDNEVGSSFEDFEKRSMKTIEFLRKGLVNEAVIEMNNRRQTVFNSFSEYFPKGYALACIVRSIDDELYTDYSDVGLQKILDKLDEIGITKADLDEFIESAKKKIESELEQYFPSYFRNTTEIQTNVNIIHKLRAEVEWIIEPTEQRERAVFNAEKEILQMFKPRHWNVYVDGNMEREMEVEFEKFMISVSKHVNEDINEISTFRFYATVEYLTDKNTQNA